MIPKATDFDLPQHILDLLNKPASNIRSEVTLPDSQQSGYQVVIKNAQDVVLHVCPHPCTINTSIPPLQ